MRPPQTFYQVSGAEAGGRAVLAGASGGWSEVALVLAGEWDRLKGLFTGRNLSSWEAQDKFIRESVLPSVQKAVESFSGTFPSAFFTQRFRYWSIEGIRNTQIQPQSVKDRYIADYVKSYGDASYLTLLWFISHFFFESCPDFGSYEVNRRMEEIIRAFNLALQDTAKEFPASGVKQIASPSSPAPASSEKSDVKKAGIDFTNPVVLIIALVIFAGIISAFMQAKKGAV